MGFNFCKLKKAQKTFFSKGVQKRSRLFLPFTNLTFGLKYMTLFKDFQNLCPKWT
eukprot:UN13314